MSVAFGSPLSSANTNAAFVSRTQDTDMVGKLDNLNTTDSSSTSTGAIHTEGGLGVEKKAHINQVYVDSLVGQKALITSASKEIIESAVTDTELDTLQGISGNVQDQIDLKATDANVVHITGNETIGGIKTFTNNVIIDGDLTVNGTTTTVNSSTLDVVDANVTVNFGGNDATAEGSGLTIDRTGTSGSIAYQSSLASKFKAGDLGSESEIITAGTTQVITGQKTLNNLILNAQLQLGETNDSTLTGTDADLPTPTPTIRLSNASLASVTMIDDNQAGKIVVITNNTGSPVIFKNENGATASRRILTGTAADLSLADDASIIVSYDSFSSRWRVVGGSGGSSTVKQEVPTGTVDGVNDTFTLSVTPPNQDSVVVFVDTTYEEKARWSLIGNDIIFGGSYIPQLGQTVHVWIATGVGGGGGGGVTPATQYFTLSGGDITAKKVTLSGSPSSPTTVLLDIIGGGPQEYSVDFTVSGNELSWNGLSLDGLLGSGDKLRVHYYT